MKDTLSILSQSAQMVGVVLIAVLVWPLVRVIRERYLVYWAWGWVSAAVGLVSLFASFRLPDVAAPWLRVVYCLGGYGFGFLLWAGSRRYTSGKPLGRADLLWLVPPVAFAAIGPFTLVTVSHLFGWHAVILTAFYVLALWETQRFTPPGGVSVGLRVLLAALVGLTVLFAHYAVLLIYHQFCLPVDYRYPHLTYSSIFDASVQAVLAFGMVCMAAERMRAELEEKNRRLAAAAVELASAARTDPLTGLLNRRGVDDLLARPEGVPAGCVAAVDMNDLKPLNDLHGHDTGDVALQLLARALRTLFRVTDPIARLGGDEFLVIMPGGSAGELARRMQALDDALKNQRLPGLDDPVDVKVAWGVSRYDSAADLPAAVKRADEAMYRQKAERKVAGGRGSARSLVLTGG